MIECLAANRIKSSYVYIRNTGKKLLYFFTTTHSKLMAEGFNLSK